MLNHTDLITAAAGNVRHWEDLISTHTPNKSAGVHNLSNMKVYLAIYKQYLDLLEARRDFCKSNINITIHPSERCDACYAYLHTKQIDMCGCRICDMCLGISQLGFILARIEEYHRGADQQVHIHPEYHEISVIPMEDPIPRSTAVLCPCPVHYPYVKEKYELSSYIDSKPALQVTDYHPMILNIQPGSYQCTAATVKCGLTTAMKHYMLALNIQKP